MLLAPRRSLLRITLGGAAAPPNHPGVFDFPVFTVAHSFMRINIPVNKEDIADWLLQHPLFGVGRGSNRAGVNGAAALFLSATAPLARNGPEGPGLRRALAKSSRASSSRTFPFSLHTILSIKDYQIWDGFFALAKLNGGRRSSATLTGMKQRQDGKDTQR